MSLIKRKSIEAVESRRPARARREDDTVEPCERLAVRQTRRRPQFAPVTFSEWQGVRFLHFGTEWVQGAMRIRNPDVLELEYAQQMMAWLLFLQIGDDFHIAQLGLGAASLTKFCHRKLSPAQVTAVELNPAVIVAARSMFALPPDDERLHVLQMDAWDFVMDKANHRTLDVIQVDLYDATARGPVLDSAAFYQACRQCLKFPGVMTINLFGDHESFPKNIARICDAFENRVLVFPEVHDGNIIALAFNGPLLEVEWSQVEQRARVLKKTIGLPASAWVEGLRQANMRQEMGLQI